MWYNINRGIKLTSKGVIFLTFDNLLFASVIMPVSVLFLFFDRSAEYKNLVLCITSFIFVIWARPLAAAIMFLSVIIDYVLALAVDGSLKKSEGAKKRAAVFLACDLVWNSAIFWVLAHNQIFPQKSALHINEIFIPIGVGFYTLKNFSYVYDVFTARCKVEKNFFCLFTYSFAYPFLPAGPAPRYAEIEPFIRNRSLKSELLNRGLTRFALGLAKTSIAVPVLDELSQTALAKSEISPVGSVIGIVAWFAYVYFAFAGMADIGAGIACLNGFDVLPNYRRISSEHLFGSLVGSYNTSLVRFANDVRADISKILPKWASALITVPIALCGLFFYTYEPRFIVIAVIIGLILAAEYYCGYKQIEKIPRFARAFITFVTAFFLLSPFAFGSMGAWKNWLLKLININEILSLSSPLKSILKHRAVVVAVCLIAVTPLGQLVSKGLDRLSAHSHMCRTAVAVSKTAVLAVLLAVSYVFMAYEASGAA